LEDDLCESKIHEDEERAVDGRLDPLGDVVVGDLVDVALGILELRAQDEPDRGHGEPAKDVRHHAPGL
jgi:putative component of toxin-antitoxin plasmid stabilization module